MGVFPSAWGVRSVSSATRAVCPIGYRFTGGSSVKRLYSGQMSWNRHHRGRENITVIDNNFWKPRSMESRLFPGLRRTANLAGGHRTEGLLSRGDVPVAVEN